MTSDRPYSPPGPAPRKKAEATLVLAERRLDQLRAEVKRRQRWFALQRSGAILGWMVAGGAAVGIGVFVARSLSSERETKEAASSTSAEVSSAATALAESVPVSSVPTGDALVAPSVPAAPEVPSGEPPSAPSSSAPSSSARALVPVPLATTGGQEAISLDDLPTRSSVEGKTKSPKIVVRKKTVARP